MDLAARLTDELRTGGDSRESAVSTMLQPGMVHKFSFLSGPGSRLVQLALDVVDRRTAAKLARGLRGRVVQAIRSPHANHVIQSILAVLTPSEAPFIVEEIGNASLYLARHEYGCRIFCRLLEKAAGDARTAQLVDILLLRTDELVEHVYRHYIIECALEHGLDHQRRMIVSALRIRLLHHVENRFGAYILD